MSVPLPLNRWWRPRARKSSKDKIPISREGESKDLSDSSRKNLSKFNTIASIIGLKQKSRSIAVQNPPRPSSPTSFATTTGDDDVLESRTPVYLPPSHVKSAVIISDPDPFASNSILLTRRRIEEIGPSNLFVSSNAPFTQASSSPDDRYPVRDRLLSDPLAAELLSLSPITSSPGTTMVSGKGRDHKDHLGAPAMVTSFQMESNRIATPTYISPDARLPTRPRGMTDVRPSRPRLNIALAPRSYSSRSLTPTIMNPSLPPACELPPVPQFDHIDRVIYSPTDTLPSSSFSSQSVSYSSAKSVVESSSTSLSSFATAKDGESLVFKQQMLDSGRIRHKSCPRRETVAKPARTTGSSVEINREPEAAMSQHSLSGRSSSQPTALNRPKKPRSFHNLRIPTPPLQPLRHASSFNMSETTRSIHDTPLDKERRKDKERQGGTTRRRYFFTGSSQKSLSRINKPMVDDSGFVPDPPSDRFPPVFINSFPSTESNPTSSIPLAHGELSNSTSAIDEHRPPDMSIEQAHQIMSPADMLKLEEELCSDEDHNRRTGDLASWVSSSDHENYTPSLCSGLGRRRGSLTCSVTSASTAFSDRLETASSISFLDRYGVHLQGRADSGGSAPFRTPEDYTCHYTCNELTCPLTLPNSRATIIVRHDNQDNQSEFGNSLPPPPRPRTRARSRITSGHGSSEALIQPLSPPPVRPRVLSRGSRLAKVALALSPNSELSSPSVTDSRTAIRPFMIRKPSFLDIEDETETENRMTANDQWIEPHELPTMEESFLDLGQGRDSIDTIRTMSTEDPC